MIIKICGMRTTEDVELCGDADILGFVVETPESPRNLSLSRAKELMNIPRNKTAVVTTCQDAAVVGKTLKLLRPDILQMHYCPELNFLDEINKIIYHEKIDTKLAVCLSIPETDFANDFKEKIDYYTSMCQKYFEWGVEYIFLDSSKKVVNNKTANGIPHDWNVSRKIVSLVSGKIFLAGGLNPENVYEAVSTVKPYGVDVSSGVESADKTSKSKNLVEKFIFNVRQSGKRL